MFNYGFNYRSESKSNYKSESKFNYRSESKSNYKSIFVYVFIYKNGDK